MTIDPPASTEIIPWKADISAHDMEILLWSRLPDPAHVDDVLRVFGSTVVIGDEWLQLQVYGKREWWGLNTTWWLTKFYYDTSNMITRIETSRRSDL